MVVVAAAMDPEATAARIPTTIHHTPNLPIPIHTPCPTPTTYMARLSLAAAADPTHRRSTCKTMGLPRPCTSTAAAHRSSTTSRPTYRRVEFRHWGTGGQGGRRRLSDWI